MSKITLDTVFELFDEDESENIFFKKEISDGLFEFYTITTNNLTDSEKREFIRETINKWNYEGEEIK